MRTTFTTSVATLFTLVTLAQPSVNVIVSNSNEERISLVKLSLRLGEWNEKSFMPLYEGYLKQLQEISVNTYQALANLAAAGQSNSTTTTLDEARTYLINKLKEITIKQEYFNSICRDVNGIVALQFLQTEALIDIIESARVYGQNPVRNYRLNPPPSSAKEFRKGKHQAIADAIALPASEVEKFWSIYKQYEEECDALLGDGYSMYSLYAGEASDFTPALAKQ